LIVRLLPSILVLFCAATVSVAQPGTSTSANDKQPANTEPFDQVEGEDIEIIAKKKKKGDNFTDVVPARNLERPAVSDTAEGTFKNISGFDLQRMSYSGNQNSRLRIRGLDESRCRVLLGGNPLHGAGVYGGYYVDWNSLALQNIERIEIIRGLAPAKYGNTLGGVINIIPRYGSYKPKTQLDLTGSWLEGAGGMGVRSGKLSHSWRAGTVGWSLSAGRYETDGYLRNAFVDRDTFAGGLTWDICEGLELTLSGRYTKTKSGMIVYNRPDSPYYRSDHPDSLDSPLGGPNLPFRNHGPGTWGPLDWGDGSYWRDNRLNLDAKLSWESDNFDFDLSTYYIDQDRSEHFKAVTNDGMEVFGRECEPEKNNWGWRADFENRFELLGSHSVEYGANGQYLGYGDVRVKNYNRPYFFGPPPPFPPHPNLQDSKGTPTLSRYHGIYIQDRWKITDWLEIAPGIRYDDFRAPGSAGTRDLTSKAWGPRIKVTVKPHEDFRVSAAYGRAYRFPTIPEYYWFYNGFQPPNRTGLSAEAADQWELETELKVKKRLSFLARGYYYNVQDYIRTVFGYRPSRVVYNLDSVSLGGVELEAKYELAKDCYLWGNYTFQKTRKRGDNLSAGGQLTDELSELPDHKFNVGISYEKKDGLHAALSLRYVGKREALYGNLAVPGSASLQSMDSFFDLDFNASYPVYAEDGGPEARLGITVENILNQYYEEQYGYPMPGLTATMNLTVRF